jgi:hypothetical protein
VRRRRREEMTRTGGRNDSGSAFKTLAPMMLGRFGPIVGGGRRSANPAC